MDKVACNDCDGLGVHSNTETGDRMTGHTCTTCDGEGLVVVAGIVESEPSGLDTVAEGDTILVRKIADLQRENRRLRLTLADFLAHDRHFTE